MAAAATLASLALEDAGPASRAIITDPAGKGAFAIAAGTQPSRRQDRRRLQRQQMPYGVTEEIGLAVLTA